MAKNALGYKPKESKGKFPQGVARIAVGNRKVKITFIGENPVEFDTGDVFKEFALSELPKAPRLSEGKADYFVKLNRDADEVVSIGPVNGVFDAVCKDLSRPQGEESDPAPYEIQPKDESWSPYLAFNAYWEIIKGPFKGVSISQFFHYKFTDDGEGNTIWDGNPDNKKAKWLPKLIEFCTAVDCVDEPIEWPDDGNVLPELLDRILDKGKECQIVVKDGYIDSLLLKSYDYVDDDDDVDESFLEPKKAAKKPAPKAKAPVKKSPAKKSKRDDL